MRTIDESLRVLAQVGFSAKEITAAIAKWRTWAISYGIPYHAAANAFVDAVLRGDVEFGRELRRAEWWKRGEAPPEYVAEYEPPEWWHEGEEPPDFGCAA